jgi:A/G-specific adenine glycosylase
VKTEPAFSLRLLNWWAQHGRHDLPWQLERTPYRVWVSEVMLQQTQVATVIDYFQRFMQRFPDLPTLAAADIDDVLALWSGLGYYARGRNLHRSARTCMAEHDGKLPNDPDLLEKLPGIGRSTANAIVAQAFNRRAPILDGNVKRVLARHAGIEGWPGRSSVLKTLWATSERLTPENDAADYTQAVMDLGATVCKARRPDCHACPLSSDCVAFNSGMTDQLPGRKPRRKNPEKETTLLLLENPQQRLLLIRRPPSGIWGGLWSLPEPADLQLPPDTKLQTSQHALRHDFTHFRLHIHLGRARLSTGLVHDGGDQAWFSRGQALALGLPQPVRKIIEGLDP